MEIIPANFAIKVKRDVLLQSSLRTHTTSYSIVKEYPLVLSNDSFDKSFCVISDDQHQQVLAHANLLTRKITTFSGKELSIGLIGNVATNEEHRGKGIMRFLFDHIVTIAESQNLSALILWSDLHDFYRKLGFYPFGKEYRFLLSSNDLEGQVFDYQNIYTLDWRGVTTDQLTTLMRLRYPTHTTIKRSLSEFEKLLSIPDTICLVHQENGTINAFGIIGKGQDMIAVMHEWGGIDPQKVIDLCLFALTVTQWQQMTLLAPRNLTERWLKAFLRIPAVEQLYPIGLARQLIKADSEYIGKLHIWGLDAI